MDVFLSDFDSYSESSSSDDQEDDEFMYGGQASCILSNLQESIGKIDDFLLFQRRYVHGDIVWLLKDPYSQMGRVTNVEMTVDLENVNGTKLTDINSKELQRIRLISMGDYVVSGPWVGKAEQITDCVSILFDDGIKCDFTITDTEKLVPITTDLVYESQYPYYPGQRVKVANSTGSKLTQWFCGPQNEKNEEGTVCAVNAGLIHVNWLGCNLSGSATIPEPPSLQSSKDLTAISSFSHSHWQVGDYCALPKANHAEGRQEIFVIVKTKSKVDVLWQDGSESCGLDSSFLQPINVLDAHDFWPHQLVLEKATSDDQGIKWGVVKAVDAKEKTVRVKWESETVGKGVEETVSAYELIEHPDYSYSQGDLVFLRNKEQQNLKNFEDTDNLAHVGIVVSFENGVVEVKWAAGFTTKVAPHEIFRVEKSEGVSNDNIDPNQVKPEHDNRAPNTRDKDSDDDITAHDSTSFYAPRAAIGFLSNVASHLFGSRHYTSLTAGLNHSSGSGSMLGFDSEEDNQVFVETSLEDKFKEAKESKDVSCLSSSENLKEIKQFDTVSDCSNHHFVDSPGKSSISGQVKKCWLKKVQQEWEILANDLPETIYVRVFEERMDLIQAAIVGPSETPYHDGLFFFDAYLPPEYPHEPPMVHYDSGGLRVNPNLYESGRVCLSLLNTWAGTGSETWNPNSSTILQVLLSLQALVLNKKPYFNEAGYDQQVGSIEGEKSSCSYNENVFLMNCKSMLYILRTPPKHFEELVEEHFSKCCGNILMSCKAYLDGVPVGCAFGNKSLKPESQKGNSTGFKIMLSKLVPKLVEAFTAEGFDCGEYDKLLDETAHFQVLKVSNPKEVYNCTE